MIRLETTKDQLIYAPLWWHEKGLSQTASGYGKRLITPYKLEFKGHKRRVYNCIFSNSGTLYINVKKQMIIIDVY